MYFSDTLYDIAIIFVFRINAWRILVESMDFVSQTTKTTHSNVMVSVLVFEK